MYEKSRWQPLPAVEKKAQVLAFFLPLLTVTLFFFGGTEPYTSFGYSISVEVIKLVDLCIKSVSLCLFFIGAWKRNSWLMLPLVVSSSLSFSIEAVRTVLLALLYLTNVFWCPSNSLRIGSSSLGNFCYRISFVDISCVALGVLSSALLFYIFDVFCMCSAAFLAEEQAAHQNKETRPLV